MNATGILWLVLFIGFAIASFKRPVYASACHVMVFFASPVNWWFGGGLLTSLTLRWSLVASGILAFTTLYHWHSRARLQPSDRQLLWLLLLMVVNAFFVDQLLADYPQESAKVFDILWKGCLATAMLFCIIRTRADLEFFLFAIVIACGFVGYQVIFTGQGGIEGGRLEGIVFPGAQGSNGTAAVLSMGLIFASYFVLSWHDRVKTLLSLVCSPLIFETILRCNSRGAYLGLAAAGACVILFTKGKNRKHAFVLCGLGTVAILLLANDEAIWQRFASVFAPAEERDASASERLLYWESAIRMIEDYPLGSGGEAAFSSPRGVTYIADFRPEFRSVHNGPLDIAAGWGLQGLAIMFALIGFGLRAAWRGSRLAFQHGELQFAFLAVVLIAVVIGQLVTSIFTSVLDGEWFLWLATLGFLHLPLSRMTVDEKLAVPATDSRLSGDQFSRTIREFSN